MRVCSLLQALKSIDLIVCILDLKKSSTTNMTGILLPKISKNMSHRRKTIRACSKEEDNIQQQIIIPLKFSQSNSAQNIQRALTLGNYLVFNGFIITSMIGYRFLLFCRNVRTRLFLFPSGCLVNVYTCMHFLYWW